MNAVYRSGINSMAAVLDLTEELTEIARSNIQSEHMLALELPAELGEQIIQAAARPL